MQINISIEINKEFENKDINVRVSLKNKSIVPLKEKTLKLSGITSNLIPRVSLYYVKFIANLEGREFNVNVEGMERLGAVKIGDGYLLLRQIFWPVLSSDTINTSVYNITCTINGVKYCNGFARFSMGSH
jgi:hypothetical protein